MIRYAPLWILLWRPVYRHLSAEQRTAVSQRVMAGWARALAGLAGSFLTATEAVERLAEAVR